MLVVDDSLYELFSLVEGNMTTSLEPLSTTLTTVGRPKDLVKRAAILQAAKDLFLRLGYDGSSMDAIAAEAKVSKLTVYSHFHDKESLFAASIAAHCVNQLPAAIFDLAEDVEIKTALAGVAQRFHGMINSQEAIELHRLMVTIAMQHPERTRLFYDAGPQRTHNEMARLLTQAHQQGKLNIPDPMIAAEYFLSSFTGCSQFQNILGLGVEDAAASERYVREVVQRFVRAYQA